MALLLAAAPRGTPADNCAPIPMAAEQSAMRMTVEHRPTMDIVRIEGRIAGDLPQRLEALFAKNDRVGEIWFNSAGGDMQAALDAGLFIRANEIYLTRVPVGAACIDACGLVFLSGRIRAVHRSSYFDVGYPPAGAESAAPQLAAITDFLVRMGVSRQLLTDVIVGRPTDSNATRLQARKCMTREQIRRYNVANGNE